MASESDCKSFFYETVPLRYSSAEPFYGLLVAAAVLSVATCPFTILLNGLVMVAVKAKQRLQTHANILLACLALPDLMVGLVAQPLHITMTIFLLQGKDFHEFCNTDLTFTISFVVLSFASFFHLVFISGERYLAIKHTFTHANVVTKALVLVCSGLAWIAAVCFFLVASYSRVVAFGIIVASFSSIALLQIFVCIEARRHEKQILSQQVSEETRAKFKKEMKAVKLTTIILVTIFVCFLLALTVNFATWQIFKENISPAVKTSVRHLSLLPVIVNSVLNPVIYTVRKREFRVAFIELLSRKSLQEAGEFERRLFGSTNNAVRPQDGQEAEGQQQDAEERNAAHAEDNQEGNPEVLVTGSNSVALSTLATQNEPVSSIARNRMSRETEEEHGVRRNPSHAENNLEDNPEDLASGARIDSSEQNNGHNQSKIAEKQPQHQQGLEKNELGTETVTENIAYKSREPKIGRGSEKEMQPEFEVISP